MLGLLCALLCAGLTTADQAGVIEFENIGYRSLDSYFAINEIHTGSNCSCSFDSSHPISLDAPNGPFDEELAVYFSGPINLRKFAYYTSDGYTPNTTSGSWTRGSYYDSERRTAENVTFLANLGHRNCLGSALTYVSANGAASASNSTVLNNVTIDSSSEFLIYSGTRCEDESSVTGDCRVYRSDSEAYHGFGGEVKAFLFEFAAPNPVNGSDNQPAISLYNARIPRTTYGTCNASTSSVSQIDRGGALNLFSINSFVYTDRFFSSFYSHDRSSYITSSDYLQRTPSAVMRGGIVFGSNATATIFLSNSTSFGETIQNSDLQHWLNSSSSNNGGTYIEAASNNTLSRNSAGTLSVSAWMGVWGIIYAVFAGML